MVIIYRGADKPLAIPGRKQARKHVRDARDFNNIETPKEIYAILTETLACFLPGRAKDLSAPLYIPPGLNTKKVLRSVHTVYYVFLRDHRTRGYYSPLQ